MQLQKAFRKSFAKTNNETDQQPITSFDTIKSSGSIWRPIERLREEEEEAKLLITRITFVLQAGINIMIAYELAGRINKSSK